MQGSNDMNRKRGIVIPTAIMIVIVARNKGGTLWGLGCRVQEFRGPLHFGGLWDSLHHCRQDDFSSEWNTESDSARRI